MKKGRLETEPTEPFYIIALPDVTRISVSLALKLSYLDNTGVVVPQHMLFCSSSWHPPVRVFISVEFSPAQSIYCSFAVIQLTDIVGFLMSS